MCSTSSASRGWTRSAIAGQRAQPGHAGDDPHARTPSAIQEHYPALAQAATAFAGVQIRNLATVVGNVCNASPAGDTLPALLAYGAECRIAGPEGERRVPLEQFCLGPGQTALQPAELLVALRLPPPPPRAGALYIKHSPRSTMDIATVGVASVVALGHSPACARRSRSPSVRWRRP